MKVWCAFFLLWMGATLVLGGTPGSFTGIVVKGPERSDAWLYIQGRNHSARRVEITGAKFQYDSDVPPEGRKHPVPTTLSPGTNVRVTAEQDEAGEWRATNVEILKSTEDEKESEEATTSER